MPLHWLVVVPVMCHVREPPFVRGIPDVFFFPPELRGDLGRWSNFATALKQTGKSTSTVLWRDTVHLQMFQIVKKA